MIVRLRARAAVVGALCALSAVLAAPASALPGPAWFEKGFVDQSFGDRSRDWPQRAEQLGSSWTRLTVVWSLVAPPTRPADFHAADPGDPRYNFTVVDAFVRSAAQHHQNLILMAVYAPAWAEIHAPASAIPGTWRPNPYDFGQFARALARRYSGHFPDPWNRGQTLPRVRYFEAWNEPNLYYALSPQWVRRNHQWQPASPVIYRGLLNEFYSGVKSVSPQARVLSAGTAPYGDPPGGPRMPPVMFTRALMCLRGAALVPVSCAHPAHADILDHHPYSYSPTNHAFSPDNVAVPDIGRLMRVARAAVRSHRLLPAGPKPFWVSEIGWDSDPPDRSPTTLAQQARYVSLVFYELWRQRINHVLWLLLRDPGPGQHFLSMGVYYLNGTPKPSMKAYRFPFVVLRHPAPSTVWGLAPVAGPVAVQVHRGHRWVTVARLVSTRGGIFYAHVPIAAHLLLRAVAGGIASQAWRT